MLAEQGHEGFNLGHTAAWAVIGAPSNTDTSVGFVFVSLYGDHHLSSPVLLPPVRTS